MDVLEEGEERTLSELEDVLTRPAPATSLVADASVNMANDMVKSIVANATDRNFLKKSPRMKRYTNLITRGVSFHYTNIGIRGFAL